MSRVEINALPYIVDMHINDMKEQVCVGVCVCVWGGGG